MINPHLKRAVDCSLKCSSAPSVGLLRNAGLGLLFTDRMWGRRRWKNATQFPVCLAPASTEWELARNKRQRCVRMDFTCLTVSPLPSVADAVVTQSVPSCSHLSIHLSVSRLSVSSSLRRCINPSVRPPCPFVDSSSHQGIHPILD